MGGTGRFVFPRFLRPMIRSCFLDDRNWLAKRYSFPGERRHAYGTKREQNNPLFHDHMSPNTETKAACVPFALCMEPPPRTHCGDRSLAVARPVSCKKRTGIVGAANGDHSNATCGVLLLSPMRAHGVEAHSTTGCRLNLAR